LSFLIPAAPDLFHYPIHLEIIDHSPGPGGVVEPVPIREMLPGKFPDIGRAEFCRQGVEYFFSFRTHNSPPVGFEIPAGTPVFSFFPGSGGLACLVFSKKIIQTLSQVKTERKRSFYHCL
jgi:hypothetical protein